jgi:hypothetical protein
MAISLGKYVNITSAVGAGNTVATRNLIARFFTANSVLAPQSFLQFTSAADVGTFFGTTSEEYYRALFYFAWISKNLTTPTAIQYARWVESATAAQVYSIPNQVQKTIMQWNSVTSGSFGLTIGGVSHTFSSLDFSAAATYADIATIIEGAITGQSGAQWTGATVTAVGNGFVLVTGSQIAATISVQPGAAGNTDITGAGYLGWLPAQDYSNNLFSSSIYLNNAAWIPGSAIETITQTLNVSQNISNNFGSFNFLNNLNFDLAQVQEAAAWNAAAAQNNMYLYSVPVIAANTSSWAAGLNTYAGLSLTLSQTPVVQTGTIVSASNLINGLMNATTLLLVGMGITGSNIPTNTVIKSITDDNTIVMSANATGSASESITFNTVQFPEQCPMMIEAATNYFSNNSVQNYMYQTFDPYLTPLVTDTSTSNSLDALSINYYGQTQTAGTIYNFYQRGLLQGTSSSPLDQNTYINEIWLKDALASALLSLLLNLNQLPANTTGQSLALLTIQGVINQALLNGTISVGKTLTTAQQTFITSVTGDANAWYQVQNSGYWVDCVIQPIPDVMPTQYEAAYTLIYSKDDTIRYVTGSDILI